MVESPAIELKEITKRFIGASDALYSGLFSCRSRIHQYFDENKSIDLALDDLRDWNFHGGNCPDNAYLLILHSVTENNESKATSAIKMLNDIDATNCFRIKSDSILKPLAQQIREMSSFWYPIRHQVRKKAISH